MTLTEMNRLLKRFNGNPPAAISALQKFEQEAGFRLPHDYLQFLQQTNGGEGFVGANSYIILWPIEDLIKMNKAYEVSEYAPGSFLFGSDGGGEAYAFDTHSHGSIVMVPFVGMDISLVEPLAENFQGFIEQLYRS